MPSNDPAPETLAVDLARECLYRFLAWAVSDPRDERWQLLFDFDNQQLARDATDLLCGEAGAGDPILGFGELPPEQLDVRPLLLELLGPPHALRAEYDRVFGLVPARECPPYETEYHATAEPFFRAQQLADVAGFYRAFGLDAARATPERPDHLALELEFMAFVLLKKRLALTSATPDACRAEQVGVCDEVQRDFFREHLAWWVPSFATGLRLKAGGGLYAAVARVLASFLPAERARLGVPAPRLPLSPRLIERPEEESGCAGCAARA
jgi:TorA maturation chaperone TorD